MSARLVEDMLEQARRRDRLASSFNFAGAPSIARLHKAAAVALREAVRAVESADSAEGEELNWSLEA